MHCFPDAKGRTWAAAKRQHLAPLRRLARATRMEALRRPPLFEATKATKTKSGLTWDVAMSVRRVLTKESKVTIVTGTGESYREQKPPPGCMASSGHFSTKCGRKSPWRGTSPRIRNHHSHRLQRDCQRPQP